MPLPRFSSLWIRIALPFLAFIAVGSLALVSWLQAIERRESRRLFATIAETNADFIRSARLPMNERVAEPLGRVLGMQMLFRHDSELAPAHLNEDLRPFATTLRELRPEQGIVALGKNLEAIANPIEQNASLLLVRPAELARHAGVEIRNDLSSYLIVSADRRRMMQAVSNVIVNAIQAMAGGGRLIIEGRAPERIELVFRDTGTGFSEQALKRHGELFFSEKEGGMGIGLSVSSEIIQAHGGTLTAQNSPEGGAVVTLSLPAEKSPS